MAPPASRPTSSAARRPGSNASRRGTDRRQAMQRPIMPALLRLAGGTLVAVAALTGAAQAGSTVNTGYFGGVAIMGYDTVAYFTDGRPMKGTREFAYDWLGTPWYFANAEHQQMFIDDPVRYAPQYGG